LKIVVVNITLLCRKEEVTARSLRLATERLKRANLPTTTNPGSEYLAHKIEEARDFILKEMQNEAEEDYKYLGGQYPPVYPPPPNYPPPPGSYTPYPFKYPTV
jgi:hypothetical protein